MPTRTRLSRDAWVDAATELVKDGGVAAVAVEPLAQRLGATKGSFYWHFTSRDDLVAAVLAAWVDAHTETVIRQVAEVAPQDRLRALFRTVFERTGDARFEMALLASVHEPAVRRALEAVTARRVAYLTQCYRDLGLPPKRAERHAVLAYSSYLGLVQLQHVSRGAYLPPVQRRAYERFLEQELITAAAP